ncbi:Rap1 GTPase-GDP dissociation stimulator 1-B [Escovopsis weberi]|uniref:Rap1 GTPase-GDP dissociation stimulator 1-B n=1 Tax=Escovopsis weberi TaxID=150374 RepID=A0A0M9VUJ8_ESCWE|nr:Rap1 GTPase-GDP dissociation stimulator 1-B [Escovopsis weberi]
MVDYEPAQLLASESRLNQQLTYLLSSPEVAELAVFVPFICKILALLITQECEPALANPETVDILLSLALTEPASNDVDDFTTLVSVALSYLANEAFQANMIAEPHFKRFLSTFHRAHTHFDPAQVEADDADSAEQLRKLRKALVVSLCDMTGRDEFAGLHYSSSPQQQQQQQQQSETVGTLLEWLRSGNAQLQAPACLALGNVSRSDEVSTSLVQTRAHAPLEAILSDHAVSDAQLLHSALSFLKNLAVPAQNKLLLTGLLEPSCLPRIMGVDASPQVQFAAVSLTRLLLVNCPANAAQVCRPSDDSSDGVDSILALYKRSDAEPTRLEAARAIASICRVLHTSAPAIATATAQPGADGGEQARQFYDKHGSATEPLAFLITQAKWPILRSEAWFVFALMSRSREGAAAVARILAAEGTKEVLYRAITGRDMPASDQDEAGASGTQIEEGERSGEDQVSALMGGMELEPKQVDPKQKESMARVDRENALVMCTELLRTWEKGADAADGGLSPLLRDLVKEGTEMIAAQKS